jgi:exodeoxyribonuclease VII small subunit
MAATDIAKLSFEDALAELEKIVRALESGSSDLKSSIDAYERGAALRKHCEARLKEAQMRIEKITSADGGKATTEAFRGAE